MAIMFFPFLFGFTGRVNLLSFKGKGMRFGLVFLMPLFFVGCALPVPHQRALTPVFQGKIVDAETDQALANVRIEVVGGYPTRSASGKSNAKGAYSLGVKEYSTWYFIRPVLSEGLCSGKITFSHPDYEEKFFSEARISAAAIDGPCGSVKLDVRLQKKPAQLSKLGTGS